MRHSRHNRENKHHESGGIEHLRAREKLDFNLIADVIAFADAGHDNRCGSRQQQRRDLGDQTVTNGQQYVLAERVAGIEIVFKNTDTDTADHVDDQHHDPGDGVTANKLRRAVHRTVEVCFFRYFLSAVSGLLLVNQTRVQIGVDSHLFARQRIQGKARGNLGNTFRPFGDHHEVDDHQDDKHHETDDEIAADDHLTKGFNDLTRRAFAFMTVQQHHAGRGDVQRQTH